MNPNTRKLLDELAELRCSKALPVKTFYHWCSRIGIQPNNGMYAEADKQRLRDLVPWLDQGKTFEAFNVRYAPEVVDAPIESIEAPAPKMIPLYTTGWMLIVD